MAPTHARLGHYRDLFERADPALAYFERARSLLPTDAGMIFFCGQARWQAGDVAGACATGGRPWPTPTSTSRTSWRWPASGSARPRSSATSCPTARASFWRRPGGCSPGPGPTPPPAARSWSRPRRPGRRAGQDGRGLGTGGPAGGRARPARPGGGRLPAGPGAGPPPDPVAAGLRRTAPPVRGPEGGPRGTPAGPRTRPQRPRGARPPRRRRAGDGAEGAGVARPSVPGLVVARLEGLGQVGPEPVAGSSTSRRAHTPSTGVATKKTWPSAGPEHLPEDTPGPAGVEVVGDDRHGGVRVGVQEPPQGGGLVERAVTGPGRIWTRASGTPRARSTRQTRSVSVGTSPSAASGLTCTSGTRTPVTSPRLYRPAATNGRASAPPPRTRA